MHVLVLNGEGGDDDVFVNHGDDDVFGDGSDIDGDDVPGQRLRFYLKKCSRPPGGKLVALVAVLHGRRPTLGTRSAWQATGCLNNEKKSFKMLYIFGPGYLKAPFKLSRLYIQFVSGLCLDRLVLEEVNRS